MQDLSVLADRARDAREWARAAVLYEAALQQAPLRSDLWVQLGHALKESGRIADAEETYRRATELAPRDADAHLQLGHALKLLGRRAEAIESYERALEFAPGLRDATRELVHLGAASHQETIFALQDPELVGERQVALGAILQKIEDDLRYIRASMPEVTANSSFPLRFYRQYRSFHPVQDPPRQSVDAVSVDFVIISHAAECSIACWEQQLRSIQAQTYGNFLFYGIGCTDHHRIALTRMAEVDGRFRWCESQDPWTTEQDLVANSGQDAVLLLAAGRELHPVSLGWFAHALVTHGALGWICDEEVLRVSEGALLPSFRRIVDRDTLTEANPYGETIAVRRDAFLGAGAQQAQTLAQRRHELLAALVHLGPIGHIPLPLARHRLVGADLPQPPLVFPWTRVSSQADLTPIHVVIPTTRVDDELISLLDSLASLASEPDLLSLHIILNVADDSYPQDTKISDWNRCIVHVYHMSGAFNWSQFNNEVAKSIESGILVFANDDMTMLSQDWDATLRGLLARSDTGAVGAKLTYPDGSLQHAGVIFGWQQSTIHDGLDEPQDAPGPAMRWQTTRAVSAVTGAFLAVKAEIFQRIGGFDQKHLMVNYGDVDLALRLRRAGFRIIWSPHIHLTHHESRSRGYTFFRPERQALWDAEHQVIRGRWGRHLSCDPSVHPVFLDATRPFRLLRPLTSTLIASYMALTARENPWSVEVEEWPNDDCFPL